MNVKDEIVVYPPKWKPIPKPYVVVRSDDHFIVCEVTDGGDLIREVSNIHWSKHVARQWALEIAGEEIEP